MEPGQAERETKQSGLNQITFLAEEVSSIFCASRGRSDLERSLSLGPLRKPCALRVKMPRKTRLHNGFKALRASFFLRLT